MSKVGLAHRPSRIDEKWRQLLNTGGLLQGFKEITEYMN
jgi:hypothetical protein